MGERDEQERPAPQATATVTEQPETKQYDLETFKATASKVVTEVDEALQLLSGAQHRLTSLAVVISAQRVEGIKPEYAAGLRQSLSALAASIGATNLTEMSGLIDRLERVALVIDSHVAIRDFPKCPDCGIYHAPKDPAHGRGAVAAVSGIGGAILH